MNLLHCFNLLDHFQSANFNLAYYTNSIDLLGDKIHTYFTYIYTHTFLHGSIWSKVTEERIRFKEVERRDQAV